jgi:hypothetical protein
MRGAQAGLRREMGTAAPTYRTAAPTYRTAAPTYPW